MFARRVDRLACWLASKFDYPSNLIGKEKHRLRQRISIWNYLFTLLPRELTAMLLWLVMMKAVDTGDDHKEMLEKATPNRLRLWKHKHRPTDRKEKRLTSIDLKNGKQQTNADTSHCLLQALLCSFLSPQPSFSAVCWQAKKIFVYKMESLTDCPLFNAIEPNCCGHVRIDIDSSMNTKYFEKSVTSLDRILRKKTRRAHACWGWWWGPRKFEKEEEDSGVCPPLERIFWNMHS